MVDLAQEGVHFRSTQCLDRRCCARCRGINTLGNEGTDAGRKTAIFGALTLYLDFINLFLSLLRLMGRRRQLVTGTLTGEINRGPNAPCVGFARSCRATGCPQG